MTLLRNIKLSTFIAPMVLLMGLQAQASSLDFLVGDYELTHERYGLCEGGSRFMIDIIGGHSFAGFYFSRIGKGWIKAPEVVPGQGYRSRNRISGNKLIKEQVYYGGLQDSAKTVLTYSGSPTRIRVQDYSTALGRTVTVSDCSYRKVR